MEMVILGLASCDTCRKARKALPDARFRDIRAEPLSDSERAAFLEKFGEKLVNRSSTTWRSLTEDERQNPPESLLAAHPSLMKRPVIVTGDVMYLGWAPDVRRALCAE
ncbi:arsenate reductase family protein [Pararhodobacter sp.]|uniref:arsenate reductase family protein n=1 Tax=Pararhodobacter sp. TaxID=2127056 RepID=UPI002FDC9BA9